MWCRGWGWGGLWKGLEVDGDAGGGAGRVWRTTARVPSREGASCLWSLGPFHRNSAPASSAKSTSAVSQPKAALESAPPGWGSFPPSVGSLLT